MRIIWKGWWLREFGSTEHNHSIFCSIGSYGNFRWTLKLQQQQWWHSTANRRRIKNTKAHNQPTQAQDDGEKSKTFATDMFALLWAIIVAGHVIYALILFGRHLLHSCRLNHYNTHSAHTPTNITMIIWVLFSPSYMVFCIMDLLLCHAMDSSISATEKCQYFQQYSSTKPI